LSCILNR